MTQSSSQNRLAEQRSADASRPSSLSSRPFDSKQTCDRERDPVSEALIERHEEAAEAALAVTLAAGLVAAAALLSVRMRHERALRTLFAVALLSSAVSTGLMARVANLGGQIRHDEIRAVAASANVTGAGGTRSAEDDD